MLSTLSGILLIQDGGAIWKHCSLEPTIDDLICFIIRREMAEAEGLMRFVKRKMWYAHQVLNIQAFQGLGIQGQISYIQAWEQHTPIF